jgi:hypothetical protein
MVGGHSCGRRYFGGFFLWDKREKEKDDGKKKKKLAQMESQLTETTTTTTRLRCTMLEKGVERWRSIEQCLSPLISSNSGAQ